ncbi:MULTISPECIES: ABC transporter ATP-binding protein [unclassified Bradyrhizobium]|jgi:sulfonate transport system ATP-binding protein|uniref:ABC transporter ATP-binding protein n=1 Tax=unclassified Bradyrhizobium TaxID=2631580 RepID=UPI001FEF10A0|nr:MULTISPECIES: ABC transporter ATP-binding protein [unclassified Bradyrhizobium]
MNRPMLQDPSPRSHGGGVQVSHVGKTYEVNGAALPVLDNIDFFVGEGEFVSIVGASGCGKSTLLRLIAGLDLDFEGAISIDGQPVLGPSLDRGIVFQDHRLFPWLNVFDNIAMAFEARPIPAAKQRALIEEHIELVGLRGFEKAFPHQLSGGMAQRAAIARALVNHPRMVLLDEPLGALDYFTRMRLQRELQTIWMTKNVTMIFITHDIDEALFMSDRIVVLKPNPGRIERIVDIDLPRPRNRESPDFIALRHEILEEFEV